MSSLAGAFGCLPSKGDHEHDSPKDQNAEETDGAIEQDGGGCYIQGIGEEGNHSPHASFDQSDAAACEGHNGQQGLTEGDEEGCRNHVDEIATDEIEGHGYEKETHCFTRP